MYFCQTTRNRTKLQAKRKESFAIKVYARFFLGYDTLRLKYYGGYMQSFAAYFEKNRQAIESDYLKLLSFRSISADPEFQNESRACAKWLADRLEKLGATTQLWREKNPSVFASLRSPREHAPTLLIYTHYDVQPVDPIEEWKSPPFEPKIVDGVVVARGAVDNKGPCIIALYAVEALIADGLPCHIKFLIDGAEESGSKGLFQELPQKKEEVAADYTMVIDLGMKDRTTPAVTLGCRGIFSMTVTLTGPKEDLHSGAMGGLAYNPLHGLVKILASLHDEKGAVCIPHFYDEVRTLSKEEKTTLDLSFDEKAFIALTGQPVVGGELEYPPIERNWLRPTLEINGIHGGYGGPGGKTVIPREAVAKISCRLVPDQEPSVIAKRVADFLRKQTVPGTHIDVVINEPGGPAVRVPVSKGIKALEKAMKMVWKNEPCRVLEGASIPVMPLLGKMSGGELIPWGLGLETDHVHSPNEQFDMQRLKEGMMTLCQTIAFLGESE